MIIGIPKEIKDNEYRVSLTPAGAMALRQAGHKVLVQKGAGLGSGFTDKEYQRVGAQILAEAAGVWAKADLIVKVKEPTPKEFARLKPGLKLFTFLHLAPNKPLTEALIKHKVTGLAYETVENAKGRFPLIEPMSEIAGRMAALVGAYFQALPQGGRGILASGMPGVLPAKMVVLGGGTVGENAARVGAGMGAEVQILDISAERMRHLDEILPPNARTLQSNTMNVEEAVTSADIVIGAVNVPGARTPRLITRAMLRKMKPGSVFVDPSADQGGCSETTRPTTHSQPTYKEEGVLHYCVTNMPGAYARTSTLALTNVTLPYVVSLATQGLEASFRKFPGFAKGLNCHQGRLTCQGVAEAHKLPFTPVSKIVPS